MSECTAYADITPMVEEEDSEDEIPVVLAREGNAPPPTYDSHRFYTSMGQCAIHGAMQGSVRGAESGAYVGGQVLKGVSSAVIGLYNHISDSPLPEGTVKGVGNGGAAIGKAIGRLLGGGAGGVIGAVSNVAIERIGQCDEEMADKAIGLGAVGVLGMVALGNKATRLVAIGAAAVLGGVAFAVHHDRGEEGST